jgi:uncharacterized membrane protein YeaQ/YmgE (transglycosylase-associated protein family)
MGFLILLSIGAALGWLSSIIFKEANGRATQLDIISGAIGAMSAGLVLSTTELVNQLSASTFFYGCIGAVAAIALSKFVSRTLIDL